MVGFMTEQGKKNDIKGTFDELADFVGTYVKNRQLGPELEKSLSKQIIRLSAQLQAIAEMTVEKPYS